MTFKKDKWEQKDKKEFLNHLLTLKRDDSKCKWERNIVNTNYECLAIFSKELKNIAKEISKGNYISFLESQIFDNLPSITIMGHIITSIENFETMKYYLDKYSSKVDNWSNCDQLKFKITKDNSSQFLTLVKEYIKSPILFRRRIAIIILFNFIDADNINQIFKIANSLFDEKEYYVNMAVAWLLCECFIKQREQTISYLQHHNLNTFTINKMISKCCDSLRISKEDKEKLKEFKQQH